MNNLAPIVIFSYNRPYHLSQTVESLLANPLANESDLYIYSDGPKDENKVAQVEEVRSYIKNISGFKSINYKFRNKNLGLSQSIIKGVSEVISFHGKAIVLEDDLVLSKHFLKFMNEALVLYQHDHQVASVHGYLVPIKKIHHLPETFFLKGTDCLGWGTWERAWSKFEKNGSILLNTLKQKKMNKAFNLDGSIDYVQMLKDQINGKNDSWAVRWHASAFIKDMLTLFPSRSLVDNIGFDNTGTHCGTNNYF